MLPDEERRMLHGAQKAAIEFGNENFRLRAENREMRAALAGCRLQMEPNGWCWLCSGKVRTYGGKIEHAPDCPFVRFAPEDDATP